MGCTSCATDNGLPKGCKSHGSCASGACNMMNTFDWLAEMPIAFGNSEGPEYYEISFNGGSRKVFYKNDNILAYDLLSEAYKAAGDFAKFYEARADLYYQLANYPKAIDDINVALNQLNSDDQLESRRLEAKKKQLQTEFNRLKKLN